MYEPTDVEIAAKLFETSYWTAVKFITPNLNELNYIASALNFSIRDTNICNKVNDAAILAKALANYLENVIVTLGQDGVLIARKALATDSFLKYELKDEIHVRHYPAEKVNDIINVSGAGDCLASGIITAMLCGLSEEICLSVGFAAAQSSLQSQSAVSEKTFGNKTHPAWNKPASYKTIL